jgi:hypothetical protein
MPWTIKEEDSQYCVYKEEGEKLKCYASKEDADAYIAALNASEKAWIENLSDVDARQLDQSIAGYKPLGFTPEKGCANCHWFVSPNSCLLVWGDVSPIGVCDLWREQPQVVYASKSWFDRLIDRLKEVFVPARPSAPVQEGPSAFVFTKDAAGRYRFFVTMTNCFKDRHEEIISVAAHKEYVAWVTESKQYPDLWLWHSGKDSKWGKADWIDFTDGFVVLSGLVDEGKEYVAENLQGQALGASHGFFGLKTKDNVIERYRTFEASALPRWAAANIWTDVNLEEADMSFTKEKREWLKNSAGVSEETIATWESSIEGLSSSLKELGLEWKDAPTPDFGGELVALADAVGGLSEMLKSIKEAQQQLATAQDALLAAQVEQTKTFEERVATVFTAKIADLPKGFEASKEDSTLTDTPPAADTSWFGEILSKL